MKIEVKKDPVIPRSLDLEAACLPRMERCSPDHGICECGKCKCLGNWTGSACDCLDDNETCIAPNGKLCSGNGECVCKSCKCFKEEEEHYSGQFCEECPVSTTRSKKGDKLCAFRDDDDCKFFFTYKIDSDGYVKIYVQRTKDCPEPVNILAIVLGVIGGIVAVGQDPLLIWKLLTTIHDRREFAKFEKERQMAKWDTGENSIYKQATSTFKNPTYGGK
ncbi:integrin beta-PS-like [Centruroides sculpturatus]|uniref:integrin beta-PS-like n=1 Tax=Centruroides sculpturatus TaxID=218467 RepID=UPI000C6CE469|nr:integrin beta-PS-like [Centruroides sculpturatus]